MNYRIILFYCLLCSFFCIEKSKAYFLTQYTTNEQLVSNTVYRAFRDSRGYIWYCTDKGLSRFDGVHFRNFNISDGLGDNEIFNMYEDRRGRLWLFTFNGQPSYYYNGQFYNAGNDSLLRKLPVLPFINTMYEEQGTLYIGYVKGDLWKIKDDKVSQVRSPLPAGKLLSFIKRGPYLMAVMDELRCFLQGDTLVKAVRQFTGNSFVKGGQLLSMDSTGVTVTGPGDYRRTYPVAGAANNVLDLYCDDHHQVLLSCRNGLLVINRNTGQQEWLLQGIAVSSVIQDQYHNYLITTLDQGVFCLNANLFDVHTLPGTRRCKITYAANTLFLQEGNELFFLDKVKQQFINRYLRSLPQQGFLPLYLDKELLLYCTSPGNTLYVQYRNTGKTGKLDFAIGHRAIRHWLKDTFLLIDYKSIYKVSISAGRIDTFTGMQGLERIQKYHFSEDSQVYFTAAGMLYRYDPFTGRTSVIDSFGNNTSIESVVTVASGAWLIAGDNRKELHIYDGRNGYKKYRVSCNYIIYSCQQLDADQYLLETQAGYIQARILPWPPFTVTFTKVQYPFLYLNVQSLYVQDDYITGRVNNELVYLKKELLNKELYAPGLFIEDININGKKYPGNQIRLNNTTECNIRIALNAVSGSRDLTYRYRIQDKKVWSSWYTTESKDINIFLSNAGRYTIAIQAVSANRKASATVYVGLDLRPPFIYSVYFYVLLVVLLLLAVILAVRFYIRKKKKVFREELKHLQLEHRAINALLNPHFIFNVVNNIQDLINNNSKESANNYLATMSKMIRQNIENLQFNLIPIENELALIRNYIELQNLRFNGRIRLVIDQHLDNPAGILVPPLSLHTFVENAIVHGFRKEQPLFTIQVIIHLTTNDYLYIRIIDDGQGLPEQPSSSEGKTSLGIDFNRKRLQRISEFYKMDFQMDVTNREDGAPGTAVSIVFYALFARLIQES